MKIRLIVSSILAIMIAAGVSHAQQVTTSSGQGRLLIGTDGGIWRGFPTAQASAMPTFDHVAGEPIRLQAAARMQSSNNLKQMGIAIHSYATSCDGQPVVRKAGGTQQEYLTITLSDVFISAATDAGWKGTCRILNVKFRNGKDYQARIRFR